MTHFFLVALVVYKTSNKHRNTTYTYKTDLHNMCTFCLFVYFFGFVLMYTFSNVCKKRGNVIMIEILFCFLPVSQLM